MLNYRRSLACGKGKEYNEGEYLVLINKSGIVSVVHRSGAGIDVFSYGGFFVLASAKGVVSAGNPYLADSLIAPIAIGALGQRSSLKSAQVLLRRKCECGV